MVLVDSSVWIEHFRKGQPQLATLLNEASVLMHPFILGELACGNPKNRADILRDLEDLPQAVAATHEETLDLMGKRNLWGRGIGWIDAHLVASALLSHCRLWTLDTRLVRASADAGVHRL
jgi:predicted nucleic acid-binding protein